MLSELGFPGCRLVANYYSLLSEVGIRSLVGVLALFALGAGIQTPEGTHPVWYLTALFGFLVFLGFLFLWQLAIGIAVYRAERLARRFGLRAVILLPLPRTLAERVYRAELPRTVHMVAELHTNPYTVWRHKGESPADAARHFQAALFEDYDRVLHVLLPGSSGWAFAVSTWHRPPEWLIPELHKAEATGNAQVLSGPRPGFLCRLGEGHRRRAQRHMFGGLLGSPVSRPERWRSYLYYEAGDQNETPQG